MVERARDGAIDRGFIVDTTTHLRFASLFAGATSAYGVYNGITEERTDGKLEGTDRRTLREPLTPERYVRHLEGAAGLGVIPIDETNTTVFGAIDVDEYATLSHQELSAIVVRRGIPVVVCRSKSGGAHLYLFAAEPVPAAKMVERLKEIAAMLAYAQAEIFPKQTKVMWEKGDLGSWINLPYFNGLQGLRYGIRAEDGEAMELEEFLAYAEEMQQGAAFFRTQLSVVSEDLPSGPPCLQHLVQVGFPPGTRNSGLFNLAVYAKKADPEGWEALVEEMNRKYMNPPLNHSEVGLVIKSARKKEYFYKCSEGPIANFCDRSLCLTRQHGVGKAGAGLVIDSIRELKTSPPVFFVSILGKTIEVSAAELVFPLKLQIAAVAQGGICPSLTMKGVNWSAHLHEKLQNHEVIEAPPGTSGDGLIWELLESFCVGRSQATSFEEIFMRKPFLHDGRHWFRIRDFRDYLKRQGYHIPAAEVWKILAAAGVTSGDPVKVGSRSLRLASVAEFFVSTEPYQISPKILAMNLKGEAF